MAQFLVHVVSVAVLGFSFWGATGVATLSSGGHTWAAPRILRWGYKTGFTSGASKNKFVQPRWPYVMRPSVCHCNSLGGAK